jgi:hypothetical protein
MNFTEEKLRQIGNYIKQNFDEISSQSDFARERSYEIQVIERITRVEEELKSQRELLLKQHEMMMFGFTRVDKHFEMMQKNMDDRFFAMQKNMDDRFTQVDERFFVVQKSMDDRFTQVDKRFDDVNHRFTMLMWAMGIGFTLTTTAISLITIFVK